MSVVNTIPDTQKLLLKLHLIRFFQASPSFAKRIQASVINPMTAEIVTDGALSAKENRPAQSWDLALHSKRGTHIDGEEGSVQLTTLN
jgi:hypothetical protein